MAMVLHMQVDGKTQGTITAGCSDRETREDTCEVYEYHQEVRIQTNERDGRTGGSRIMGPAMAEAPVNQSTPKLKNALVTNESLTVTFRWYRFNPEGDGKEQQFYTIVLTDARLSKFETILPDVKDHDTTDLPPMVRMEFSFGKITETYEPDGIVFEDAWTMNRT